jgi:hypothetical protein
MTNSAFWHGSDDDQAAARFAAEHAIVSNLDDDVLEMAAGNEALLPEWPPVIRLPNLLSIPMPAGASVPDVTECKWCGTPLARREGSWCHETGYRERGGCTEPTP